MCVSWAPCSFLNLRIRLDTTSLIVHSTPIFPWYLLFITGTTENPASQNHDIVKRNYSVLMLNLNYLEVVVCVVSRRRWASLFSLKILSRNLGCSCELPVVSLGASTGMLFYPRVSDFHSIILTYIKSLLEKFIWSTEINALKYLLKSFLQFCLYWGVFTKPLHTLQNFLHTLLCTGLRNKKKNPSTTWWYPSQRSRTKDSVQSC